MRKLGYTFGALLFFSTQNVFALETHGYFRDGLGMSENGNKQECFGLIGAPSKYRLGNECELYAEFSAKENLLNLSDGSKVNINGMLQLYNRYNQSLSFDGDNGFARLNEVYVDWSNISYLNGANIWVGRRYYNRNTSHLSDFFYWDQSGTGFGLDNYKIGDYKFSYVFSRKDSIFQKKYISRHDITVKDIKLNKNNELQAGISYIDNDQNNGWSVTIQDIQKHTLNGTNRFILQYGQGPGIGLGYTGDVSLDENNYSFRILDILDWESKSNKFNGQAQIAYQKNIFDKTNDFSWFSAGVRTSYVVNDHIKITGEVGYDQIEDNSTRNLSKVTIAPTWSFKGTKYYDRPELRVYYTYAHWNDAEKELRDIVYQDSSFFNSNHGSNFGIQVETWW